MEKYNLSKLESINASQRQMLTFMKMKGAMTIAHFADIMQMSAEGVRLHINDLMDQALVIAKNVASGKGRPKQFFELTTLGDQLFPDTHAQLTINLLKSVKNVFGDEGLQKLMDDREILSGIHYQKEMDEEASLETKLELFVKARTRDGYMAEWSKEEDHYLFIENHCPICAAANECQGLCNAELNNIKKLFGDATVISRTEHIVSGNRRCVYEIKMNEG